MAAVVAVQPLVAVQHERDVAVRAAEGRPAGAAVERRRDPAPVEQQDRLAAALGDPAELGEQRRRERVAGLAPQVDDAHRRQLRPEPLAQLEPLQPLPALGPRRRAAVERNRTLERGALRRHRPGVVARVGLLLVRRVVLLVDADQADAVHRREDRRASADDDPRLAARDPLALVAALGVGQPRVQDRHGVAEAGAKAADRLRRERDLRHEHDRAQPTLERGRRGLEVDLGLAAAGRPVEQEVAAARSPSRRPPPRPRRPGRHSAARARPRPRATAARPVAPAPCGAPAAPARPARAPAPGVEP